MLVVGNGLHFLFFADPRLDLGLPSMATSHIRDGGKLFTAHSIASCSSTDNSKFTPTVIGNGPLIPFLVMR
jgi:hypothetical protein